MTRHDETVRLRHMLDFACKAVAICEGRARNDLDQDEVLALALARLIELIGEAARSVSPHTRAEMPGIPWREIIGTRDRLVHAYPEVNPDILWGIVADDLPRLVAELKKKVPREPN
jgi:uncharacterized protein with HEPN domain